MNTLHLDTGPDWRGGQAQALLLVRGLLARGHGAELIAVQDTPLAKRAQDAGVRVHAVCPHFRRISMARTLRGLLRDQSFDIIHAHEPHGLTAAWLAGVRRRASLVASRRVAYPLSPGRAAMARYLAVRRIIAVSRYVDASIVTCGLDPSRIAVVHDGVPVPSPFTAAERSAARTRWGVTESEFLLGCLGYFLPEKGQEVLLHALALLKERFPQCWLLLAGRGPYRGHLELLARQLGIADRVIFTGFIEDVDSVYAALDIFLFPSLAEPLGTSLLDAMARGLPVIAVASGGVPEILEDGKNGRMLVVPDREAFAGAVARLLQNLPEAAILGAAGRETVLSRFSDDHMTEATLAIYSQTLSEVNSERKK
jgi:glycosyltransferase involved in cell wall biosynthesis